MSTQPCKFCRVFQNWPQTIRNCLKPHLKSWLTNHYKPFISLFLYFSNVPNPNCHNQCWELVGWTLQCSGSVASLQWTRKTRPWPWFHGMVTWTSTLPRFGDASPSFSSSSCLTFHKFWDGECLENNKGGSGTEYFIIDSIEHILTQNPSFSFERCGSAACSFRYILPGATFFYSAKVHGPRAIQISVWCRARSSWCEILTRCFKWNTIVTFNLGGGMAACQWMFSKYAQITIFVLFV